MEERIPINKKTPANPHETKSQENGSRHFNLGVILGSFFFLTQNIESFYKSWWLSFQNKSPT